MLRAESSQVSFYGNHIYDRLIPEGHLLKLLDKVGHFLALESAVTPGSNAVCLYSSLVTPAPQGVGMNMVALVVGRFFVFVDNLLIFWRKY
jgi:hypothetical protein